MSKPLSISSVKEMSQTQREAIRAEDLLDVILASKEDEEDKDYRVVSCHDNSVSNSDRTSMNLKICQLTQTISVLTETVNSFKGDLVKYSNEVVALNWRILLLEQENRCMRAIMASQRGRPVETGHSDVVHMNDNGEVVYTAMT